MTVEDFRPDLPQRIRRILCLDIRWFDADPMPAVCRRLCDHDGEHAASCSQIRGPVITWE